MVSNFDRIFAEITKRAARHARSDLGSETLATLILELVEVEDQHRLKRKHGIDRHVEERIRAVALGARRHRDGGSAGDRDGPPESDETAREESVGA